MNSRITIFDGFKQLFQEPIMNIEIIKQEEKER